MTPQSGANRNLAPAERQRYRFRGGGTSAFGNLPRNRVIMRYF